MARWRAIKALFRWAARQEPALIKEDPTAKVDISFPKVDQEIGFLTVAEAAAILANPGKRTAALSLMLFAGIRPEEMAGQGKPWLDWSHIDRKAKIIRIPADISKTRKPRIIQGLPQNIWFLTDVKPLRKN